MISTSNLILDGHHGHRLGPGPGSGTAGPHHMSLMDPYLRSKLPTSLPDFMRPFPKPNPISSTINNQRPSPAQSPRKEYLNVPASVTSQSNSSVGPVNLTSLKLEGANIPENHISTSNINIQLPHLAPGYAPPRIFPPPGFPYPSLQSPFSNLFSDSYSSMMNRHTYLTSASLGSLETQYSSSEKSMGSSNSSNVFLQTSNNFTNTNSSQISLPSPTVPSSQIVKSTQSLFREKRPFKIPSLKESSNKQKLQNLNKNCSKRVMLTSSVNNTNSNNNNNNNLLPPNFTKGSLIQLANGDLRKVEDVTTEELVSSAERCPAFRLDPSTVVKILENSHGTVLLTLSYGENKKTIEMESTLEHPYFVYGQGWASCSPEKTMNCYGLQCHRLQVGDICISLSPRPTQDSEDKPSCNRKLS